MGKHRMPAPGDVDRKVIRALVESAIEAAESARWGTYSRRCTQAYLNHGHPGMCLFLLKIAAYVAERVHDAGGRAPGMAVSDLLNRVQSFGGPRPAGDTRDADTAMLHSTTRFVTDVANRRESEARQLYSELATTEYDSGLIPSGLGAFLVVLGPPGDSEPEYWRRMGRGT